MGDHTDGFAQALRSALREDPDVILVGEMRDLDTISLAVTAAEMGILILATLHTNGAAAAIDRIINVFPPGEEPYIRAMLSTKKWEKKAIIIIKIKPRGGKISISNI